MDIKTEFNTYPNVHLQIDHYLKDNSIAIQAWNQEEGPIARLTVCLNDTSLEDDESYVDTNNNPWAIDFIEKNGLGKRTGRTRRSGFCTYPVVKFDLDKIKSLTEGHDEQ